MKYLNWLKYSFSSLKLFPVDAIIVILGIIGFVAWIFGYEPGFFALGFTLYGTYNTIRLRSALDKIKELQ